MRSVALLSMFLIAGAGCTESAGGNREPAPFVEIPCIEPFAVCAAIEHVREYGASTLGAELITPWVNSSVQDPLLQDHRVAYHDYHQASRASFIVWHNLETGDIYRHARPDGLIGMEPIGFVDDDLWFLAPSFGIYSVTEEGTFTLEHNVTKRPLLFMRQSNNHALINYNVGGVRGEQPTLLVVDLASGGLQTHVLPEPLHVDDVITDGRSVTFVEGSSERPTLWEYDVDNGSLTVRMAGPAGFEGLLTDSGDFLVHGRGEHGQLVVYLTEESGLQQFNDYQIERVFGVQGNNLLLWPKLINMPVEVLHDTQSGEIYTIRDQCECPLRLRGSLGATHANDEWTVISVRPYVEDVSMGYRLLAKPTQPWTP